MTSCARIKQITLITLYPEFRMISIARHFFQASKKSRELKKMQSRQELFIDMCICCHKARTSETIIQDDVEDRFCRDCLRKLLWCVDYHLSRCMHIIICVLNVFLVH